MPTAAYFTLGCKVNQYETEQIRVQMERSGFRTAPFNSQADVYIINSCTVTSNADSKSRKAVRSAVRSNPNGFVVATGCYAHLKPEEIRGISGVNMVVSNEEKESIPSQILRCLPETLRLEAERDSQKGTLATRQRIRTRAVVKVQDGCDNFCAYCAVPFARSIIKSRPISEVIEEIGELAASGFKEIVLTGIRLGKYQDGQYRLPELILKAGSVSGIQRIRLSSIEPMEVNDKLLDAVASEPKCCRHLHIPLQSGDDEILKKMNRPYSSEEYIEMAKTVKNRIPGVGLTTDVMVGFPGETDAQFENTLRAIDAAGFSRLHVFRFSPRPGTIASAMEEKVPAKISESRARVLGEINDRLMQAFAENLVGQTLNILVESRERSADGYPVLAGHTDNYVEASFAGPSALKGAIVQVKITGARNGKLVGDLLKGG